jgi:hypothetical protein
MGVNTKQGAMRASIRELTPMFHRPPDGVWAQCFRIECDASPEIDWYDADFAKCRAGDVTAVIDALREATAAADRRFIAHLRQAQPHIASDAVQAEMISAESVGADGPYMLPIGPPSRTY